MAMVYHDLVDLSATPVTFKLTYMTSALIMLMLYRIPASAALLLVFCRLVRSSDRKETGARFFRKLSRSFLKLGLIRAAKFVTIRGAMEISGNISTWIVAVKHVVRNQDLCQKR